MATRPVSEDVDTSEGRLAEPRLVDCFGSSRNLPIKTTGRELTSTLHASWVRCVHWLMVEHCPALYPVQPVDLCHVLPPVLLAHTSRFISYQDNDPGSACRPPFHGTGHVRRDPACPPDGRLKGSLRPVPSSQIAPSARNRDFKLPAASSPRTFPTPHIPPRLVLIPRTASSAAMARSDSCPPAWIPATSVAAA